MMGSPFAYQFLDFVIILDSSFRRIRTHEPFRVAKINCIDEVHLSADYVTLIVATGDVHMSFDTSELAHAL